MKIKKALLASAIIAGLSSVSTSQATTLMRASLDELVQHNHTIIAGEVVDMYSYWNADSSFIFTDVTISIEDNMKGRYRSGNEVTFTLMGGTVNDRTAMIVAGPNVKLGSDYVFFLNNEDLPGAKSKLTIRELSQGIFDLIQTKDGARVISQANGHALYPDSRGNVEVAGGTKGYLFSDFKREVNEIAVNVRDLTGSAAK